MAPSGIFLCQSKFEKAFPAETICQINVEFINCFGMDEIAFWGYE